MADLTHVDKSGKARMVDITGKNITVRTAVASGKVRTGVEVINKIKSNQMAKGDVLSVARVAGIMAAKKTSELIPLCHPIPIENLTIDFDIGDDSIEIIAGAKTSAKTGLEMEALTAVSAAALTIYDMCKAVTKSIVIEEVRLEGKSGGKSGDYSRGDSDK